MREQQTTKPQDPTSLLSQSRASMVGVGPAGGGSGTPPTTYLFEFEGWMSEGATQALVWINAEGKAQLSFAPKHESWGPPIWGERA